MGALGHVTQPTIGNHEYLFEPNDGTAWRDYWHQRPLYTSFVFANALFLNLNSNTQYVSMSQDSAQYNYVKDIPTDPSNPPQPCIIAYFHTRKAAENIDSLIDGWYAADKFGPITRQRFAQAGYPIARQLGLKDYSGKWWKFALVPGWRDLKGQTVSDVAAWQYLQCNRYALQDLETIGQRRVMHIKHEDFVLAPVEIVRAIYAWADLPRSSIAERFAQALPAVNGTWPTAKKRNRALRYSKPVCAEIDSLPEMSELQTRLGYH